jgi:hypothetical protein
MECHLQHYTGKVADSLTHRLLELYVNAIVGSLHHLLADLIFESNLSMMILGICIYSIFATNYHLYYC